MFEGKEDCLESTPGHCIPLDLRTFHVIVVLTSEFGPFIQQLHQEQLVGHSYNDYMKMGND